MPTISPQTPSIMDLLELHGVSTDTTELTPHFSQEEDDFFPYDVLTIPQEDGEGSLFLPYVHTQSLMEIRELHWSHSHRTSSISHVFTLTDPSNYTVIVQQILNLLTDKGQQLDG